VERAERAVCYSEIVETLARYALIIDRREWSSLSEVFTPEATFDATSVGYDFLEGLGHIQQHMATDAKHPVAHLVVNVTAEIESNRAAVTSRLLGLQANERVFVGEYQDVMVRGAEGWRITSRVYRRLSTRSHPGTPESLTS
jgi:SnoaL-like domain